MNMFRTYEEVGDERKSAEDAARTVRAVRTVRWTQKPFVRQMAMSSCVWMSFFQLGLYYGACPVLVAQLKREPLSDNTVIDDEKASWIASAGTFTAIPCVLLITLMTEHLGRKPLNLFVMVTSCTGFVVFYCTTTYNMLIIAQILQGPLFGSPVSLFIASECISPKYRGVCLTIQSATGLWAMWLANAVGTFFHWKNIGIIGFICAVYSVLVIIMCPESPYWLASKGKNRECREAHRWFRGTDKSAEKDLECLMKSELERHQEIEKDNNLYQRYLFYVKKMLATEFYQPLCLCILLSIMMQLSGKLVLSVYAIDIINKITANESAAYTGMLTLDGITIIGVYIGCVLTRYTKRRTLFFCTAFLAIVFLFIVSLYLYLIKLGFIKENVYLSLSLLLAFSLSVSSGPVIMIFSLIGELLPLQLRSLAAILQSLASATAGSVAIKLNPWIFSSLGAHGAFLYFAVGSLVCAMILLKYLPETKNKTLQEIENLFKVKEKLKQSMELAPLTKLIYAAAGNEDNLSI